ncbi:MAG TPA: GntR family transcriptional regulator [Limnochordia bacterium]
MAAESMRAHPSREGQKPLYQQLQEILRAEIRQGRLAPNEPLPGEHRLVEQYGVSRTTVRQALQGLVAEGMVVRRQGRGTFVAGGEPDRPEAHVAVVVPHPEHYLMPEILGGLRAAVAEAGYTVRVYDSADRPDEEARMVEAAKARGAAGLVLVPAEEVTLNECVVDWLGEGRPIVLMDRAYHYPILDLVATENAGGAFAATRHLIELGHRRIAFIARGSTAIQTVEQRYRGYRAALRAAELPLDDELVFIHPIDQRASGWQQALDSAVERFLADVRPTAAFVQFDGLAMDVIRAAQRLGLAVPGDLSVVGFDDAPLAGAYMVPLTTVRQPLRQIGAEAGRRLLARLAGESGPVEWTYLPAQLVVRASTGPPGAAPAADAKRQRSLAPLGTEQ